MKENREQAKNDEMEMKKKKKERKPEEIEDKVNE